MNTCLPRALELSDGQEYPINCGFRDILNLFEAMNDPDATPQERGYYLLVILYEDFETIPQELWEEAVEKGLWFLNGGTMPPKKEGPKLMDWGQDLPVIIPSINRVAGTEVRELLTSIGGLFWATIRKSAAIAPLPKLSVSGTNCSVGNRLTRRSGSITGATAKWSICRPREPHRKKPSLRR